jgi:nucleoside-diphosphate-sugar epimerase
MRLFITGGTGFIGKPLCAALAAGHELLVLKRSSPSPGTPGEGRGGGSSFLQGDLSAVAALESPLRAFAPQACIHLAWAGLPDYSLKMSRQNFQWGLDLLDLLKTIGCARLTVTGTCFEYGTLTGQLAEDAQPQKQGLFAAFKAAQRLVARSLSADGGTSLIWARPFFVYGPGQRATSLIPSCIAALAAGRNPEIKSPDVVNDFIYVDDVAAGLAALTTGRAPAGTYNLGSAMPIRVRDVVNLVAREMNQPEVYPQENHGPDAPATSGFWSDQSRTRAATGGWEPRVSLEEGIRRTIAAWKAQLP